MSPFKPIPGRRIVYIEELLISHNSGFRLVEDKDGCAQYMQRFAEKIETVKPLQPAAKVMKTIATITPGRFFICENYAALLRLLARLNRAIFKPTGPRKETRH